MKKKLTAIALAALCVLSLSSTALAVNEDGTAAGPGIFSGTNSGSAALSGDRSQLSGLITAVMENRAAILDLKSENVLLASQLRTLLCDLKASGESLSEETLAELQAFQTQLKSRHDELAATKGEIQALMTTYKEYRRARDFDNAAAVLEQVIAVQESRIAVKTEIGSLLAQMIELLNN